MTGTTKAWLGRFGEVGHPYSHPAEKQCNYSVDTYSKSYIDNAFASFSPKNAYNDLVPYGRTKLLGTYTGRFANTTGFSKVPEVTIYAYNTCAYIVCDWTGTASSAGQSGFEVKIGSTYKTLALMIYHKRWNGGNTYFVWQPLSSDDVFGYNEDYAPFCNNVRCEFENAYGTWKSPSRIHAFLYIYSPLCYIN